MDSPKKHGDPLADEIRQDPARGIEEVASNQPGSKGRREEEDHEVVRSADQKPKANQRSEDPSMRKEVDPKRSSNM
jgi:hypothetical protein